MDPKRAGGKGPSGRPGGDPPPSGDDVTRILLDFRDDQVERKKRRDSASRPKEDRRNRVLVPVLLVLAVLTAWVWLAPPAFLLPEPLPEPSEAEVLAGLRLDVYGASVQLLRHREQNGGFPASLADVATDVPAREDLQYERLSDDRFVLTASRGGASVTYDSSEPLGALLEPVRREVGENESDGEGS